MSGILFARFSLDDEDLSAALDASENSAGDHDESVSPEPFRIELDPGKGRLTKNDLLAFLSEVKSSLDVSLAKFLSPGAETSLSIASFEIEAIQSSGILVDSRLEDFVYSISFDSFLTANDYGGQPSFRVKVFFEPSGDEDFDAIFAEGFAFDLRLSVDLSEIYSLLICLRILPGCCG